MKKTLLIGIVMIVLGVLSLGYEGITYMTQEEVLDVGPLELDVQKEETLPIPRVAGLVFLVGGVITVVYSTMK